MNGSGVAEPDRVARLLLPAVLAGIALVLLTPLVWSPVAWHPFSVGKAVYARSLIAAVFALWTLLALARPRYRPPPTAVLFALLAGLAVAALSSAFGVSPQRSLWSTYTRMDGLIDAAHWTAFAVVLTAVLGSARDWHRLLNLNLAVGLCVAVVAVLRFHHPDAGPFGLLPEARHPRISATTGNPTFLGAYLQMVILLAGGFLARSSQAADPEAGAAVDAGRAAARRTRRPQHRRKRGKRRRAAPRAAAGAAAGRARWPTRLFWALTAAVGAWALVHTGSMGAVAGLGAGLAVAAALVARFGGTRRERRLALGGLATLGLAGAALVLALGIRAAGTAGDYAPAFDSILLERATSTERIGNTLGGRLRNWESGIKAFAERPLLGWGTGNYHAASGRHLAKPPKRTEIADHAHNIVVEEAATKGLAGLAAYVLLWGATGWAVLRRVRAAGPRERTLAIFAGGALTGWFVQSQTLFYAPTILLQHTLLLAYAAHLEACAPHRWPWVARLRAAGARAGEALSTRARRLARPARVAAAAAAMALAGASIASSLAVHAGSAAIWRAEFQGPWLEHMERSMRAFAPLANGPRVILFNNLAVNWPVLAEHHPEEADRLLAWSAEEALAALAAEPESWVIHHALTRMYRAIAKTRPEYAATAERHLRTSLALAPNLDPMEAPVGRPLRR